MIQLTENEIAKNDIFSISEGEELMMKEIYKPLVEPFTFKNGVQLKNRIVMAPMTTFSANPDDTASDAELAYYAAAFERTRNGHYGLCLCSSKWKRF